MRSGKKSREIQEIICFVHFFVLLIWLWIWSIFNEGQQKQIETKIGHSLKNIVRLMKNSVNKKMANKMKNKIEL